jgi:hypothetical protein
MMLIFRSKGGKGGVEPTGAKLRWLWQLSSHSEDLCDGEIEVAIS